MLIQFLPNRQKIFYIALLFLLLLTFPMQDQVARAQESEAVPASQAQADKVYLPFISNGGNTDATPPTPTVTATPLPPITLTPGPVTAPLPDPDGGSAKTPTNGQCPAGAHLVHNSLGLIAFGHEADADETVPFNDADYTCQPDQSLDQIACGVHGQATLIGGVAACSCDAGYAGATCTVCAPGHAPDAATGQCKAVETPPTGTIRGADASLEVGGSTIFTATDPAGNRTVATWTLVQPTGVASADANETFAASSCLFAIDGDGSCQRTVTGVQVGFRAPVSLTTGVNATTVAIEMRPLNGLGLTTKAVVVTSKNGIPITGVGDPAIAPVLDAMSAFMKQRCVGAGMLGVSRYGVPLAVYGFGRMDGRASNDWRSYCGDDMSQPLAEPVTNQTPMRVGSANKGITFGVLRWTLSERLKALDTDLALAVVAPYRAVALSRAADNTLRLTVWLIAENGELVELDRFDQQLAVKDLDLVMVDGSRVAAVLRTAEDQFQLRSYTISDIGQVSAGQLFTITEPDQKIVDVATTRILTLNGVNPRLAVASRQNDGDYNLRIVEVAGDSSFSVVGGYQYLGGVRDVAIADVSALLQRRVVVALRGNDNTLRLRPFNIAANGQLTPLTEISAGALQALALTAVSESRVVAGVRTDSGNLKLIVYDIATDGTLTRRGDDEAGAVSLLSLAALNDRTVAAAVRQQNGNLKLVLWSLGETGTLTRAGEDEAGGINGLGLVRLSATRLLVGVRTQSNTLKNIVWDLPSATTLQRKGEGDGGALTDYPWTDADVEALHLLGYDFPERLLPANLLDVLGGVVQLPIAPIADSVDFGALEGGHPLCPTLTNKADSQWLTVQIKHLLSHRTGLPHDAPGLDYQLSRLAQLRGLSSQADFVAQEAQLRAEFGDVAVTQGKERLFYDNGTTLYVTPRPTIHEILMLVAARCLRYPLGEYHYSNTSPTIGAVIIAHIMQRPFGAQQGYPEEHEGSALDQFFARTLGIESTANTGVFSAQRILLPSYDQREPRGRGWNGSTYYPQKWDGKRPHCVWTGSACSFTDWLANANQVGRLHWQWFVAQLPFVQASDDTAWGASGGIAMTPGTYLRYMNERWIAGYGSDPTIGAERSNTWNVNDSHNGSSGGAYAFGLHYGSTTADQFAVPYDPNQGYMAGDQTFDSYVGATRAYYVANPVSGEVTRYHNELPAAALDLNFTYGNAFAMGNSMFYPTANAYFVARHDTGVVEIYSPQSAVFNNIFSADYAVGDDFIVEDLLTADVYDEVIIGDSSTGAVRIFSSQGFLTKTLNLNFAAGDQLAVGDYYGGDGSNELFIARVATGEVQIYTSNGGLALSFQAGFTPQGGFAVGDVLGSVGSADVIIGNPLTGYVSIYTYSRGSNAYSLYTSFYSAYGLGTPITVSEPVTQTKNHELLVTSYANSALRWQAQKLPDDTYQFTYVGVLPVPFANGAGLAAGHGLGKRLYECSLSDGRRQSFPEGIDVVVSINQGGDKQCKEAGGCSGYYQQLPNVLKYGLCQVDWSSLLATPPAGQ